MVIGLELEVGVLIAFIMYIQRFFDPIRNLTMQYTQLQRSMASGARIFELLDTEPDLIDAPDAARLPKLKGEVELKGLTFSYAAAEEIALLDDETDGGRNGHRNGSEDGEQAVVWPDTSGRHPHCRCRRPGDILRFAHGHRVRA